MRLEEERAARMEEVEGQQRLNFQLNYLNAPFAKNTKVMRLNDNDNISFIEFIFYACFH